MGTSCVLRARGGVHSLPINRKIYYPSRLLGGSGFHKSSQYFVDDPSPVSSDMWMWLTAFLLHCRMLRWFESWWGKFSYQFHEIIINPETQGISSGNSDLESREWLRIVVLRNSVELLVVPLHEPSLINLWLWDSHGAELSFIDDERWHMNVIWRAGIIMLNFSIYIQVT